MHKIHLFLFTGVSLTFSFLHAASDIQILPCDQPVKSPRRGICLNKMDRKDFMALAPGVSWWYNWHYKDTRMPRRAKRWSSCPWHGGDRKEDLAGLKTFLASNKPSVVLAINEPNLRIRLSSRRNRPRGFTRTSRPLRMRKEFRGRTAHGPWVTPPEGSITAEDPSKRRRSRTLS